jgi:multimeric flavodoxin WrbA
MTTLLVVHHSPTRGVAALTDAVLDGAHDDEITGVEVVAKPALEATAEDVLAADGYVLGTPANFGYMSGALKHFFDSTFLQVGGALSDDGSAGDGSDDVRATTRGRPWGLYVHGRYDTAGAVRAVRSIVGALGWRQSAEVLSVLGDVTEEHRAAAYELGGTIAALIAPDS